MGSGGLQWNTGDVLTAVRLNQKTVFTGTGAQITALSPTYAGQLAFCTSTGSGFTAGRFYQRNAGNTAWKIVGVTEYEYILSDAKLHVHDAEATTTSQTYVKKKTITLNTLYPDPSTIRISFEIYSDDAGFAVYGRIYKNGVASGTERSHTSAAWIKYTEDLSFADGDTCELWLHSDPTYSGHTVRCRNFRIHGDIKLADIANAFSAANS